MPRPRSAGLCGAAAPPPAPGHGRLAECRDPRRGHRGLPRPAGKGGGEAGVPLGRRPSGPAGLSLGGRSRRATLARAAAVDGPPGARGRSSAVRVSGEIPGGVRAAGSLSRRSGEASCTFPGLPAGRARFRAAAARRFASAARSCPRPAAAPGRAPSRRCRGGERWAARPAPSRPQRLRSRRRAGRGGGCGEEAAASWAAFEGTGWFPAAAQRCSHAGACGRSKRRGRTATLPVPGSGTAVPSRAVSRSLHRDLNRSCFAPPQQLQGSRH